jgi:DNA-binding transcriptional regulator LsrR (DeoR family)
MVYKRTEIAELIGISSRTLQRMLNKENLGIAKNVRLTKKDVEKIDLRFKTNILRYLR